MARLNWALVMSNVAEAREQLQEIERDIAAGGCPADPCPDTMFGHAYHHLNVAWDSRRVSARRYVNLSDDGFSNRGQFPKEIDPYST